jgi:hypothetical protein
VRELRYLDKDNIIEKDENKLIQKTLENSNEMFPKDLLNLTA